MIDFMSSEPNAASLMADCIGKVLYPIGEQADNHVYKYHNHLKILDYDRRDENVREWIKNGCKD